MKKETKNGLMRALEEINDERTRREGEFTVAEIADKTGMTYEAAACWAHKQSRQGKLKKRLGVAGGKQVALFHYE